MSLLGCLSLSFIGICDALKPWYLRTSVQGTALGSTMDHVGTEATMARAPCPFLLYILCLLVVLSPSLWQYYEEPGKKIERENREKKTRQLMMEAVGSRAACALPCLGSSRPEESGSGISSTANQCSVQGKWGEKGFWASHAQRSLLPAHKQ